jgi:hydroxymethylglutaryl-CoA lyase
VSASQPVIIGAVGLRDGRHGDAPILPIARKLERIGDAWAAGQRKSGSAGSFRLPELADVTEPVVFGKTLTDLFALALVPTLNDAGRTLEAAPMRAAPAAS